METLFRDRLPKGLAFPLGIEALRTGAPALEEFRPGVLFTWQSTWASQLYDPLKGHGGRLAILHLLRDLPAMHINDAKVRTRSPQCRLVIAEFAISSTHRRLVLDNFLVDGGEIISRGLSYWPYEGMGYPPFEGMAVWFDLEKEVFVLPVELGRAQ